MLSQHIQETIYQLIIEKFKNGRFIMKKHVLTENRKKILEKYVNQRCKALQENKPLNEKGGFWSGVADIGQGALSGLGMIPGVGNIADLANAGWSAARGNYGDAALNLAAAVPGAGLAVGGANLLNKGTRGAKGLHTALKTGQKAHHTTAPVKAGYKTASGTDKITKSQQNKPQNNPKINQVYTPNTAQNWMHGKA